ncbi:MAG: SusC/RagA family TonB-linked outer membrane protein [Alistipes sp.]
MKIKSQLKANWLLPVLTFLFCLSVGQTHAQSVPVSLKVANAPLEQVLNAIEKQTTYLFVYDKNVDIARKVSVNAAKTPLKTVLDQLFKSTNIVYAVENTSIVLSVNATKQQANNAISGVVSDVAGLPVIGASVMVKGTTIGTSTGVDGSFSLQVPPPAANAILSVDFLGYEPVEVQVGAKTNLAITLKESSVKMDEVVVTALGIKRSEKALSYNVQKVNQGDIVTVKDVNFVNALSGKVAGVNINASSSGVGGASKVVMRGTKSINQSSNALYVIDGVPMYNFGGEGSQEFQSTGSSEAIADINPEDIDNISVLTGAAAAALYGSEAANGAIVVTTKKGQKGFTTVTVTSNTEVLQPFSLPEFQNRYGTSEQDKSWGNLLNESNYMGYSPKNDYFQTGVIGTETVSLSTGTDKNQTYVSASAVNSRGIVPNNGYDRYNFSFRNTTSFFKDKMTLDVGGSYIKQKDLNMINQGTYSNPLTGAYLFPRGNDWSDIQMFERYDTSRKISTQYWPSGAGGSYAMQNPYWINHRNLRENNKDRYMMNVGLSYDILDWLNVSGRIRIDNTVNDFSEKLYATTNTLLTEDSPNGLYGITRTKDKQTYGDVLVNINKTFGEDWSLHANIGASFSDMRSDAMKVRGPINYGLAIVEGGLTEPKGIPNVFNLYNLSNSKTVREQMGYHDQTQSVFASVEVGYKNTYFLTVTGRNDWPSQLAGPQSVKRSFFYPSVGASVVVSQIVKMPKQFSYLKLRGSYASVGLAFKRFLANPTNSWDNNSGAWVPSTVYPMYNLKPERTKSWEIGITARFLQHFNLDLTYYNTRTINQTFDPVASASSGSKKFYIQDGDVQNRGVELALGYTNKWNKFSWSSNFTMSANSNKILRLANEAVNPYNGEKVSIDFLNMGGLGQTRFILKEGGSMGDLYSRADLVRDSNGDIYVNENGEIEANTSIKEFDKFIKLGSVLPKANMAWRNDFKYGNLSFGFMIAARLGGVAFSRTQAALDYFGVSEASAATRDAGGMMINGGDMISAQQWYTAIGNNDGIPQYYTYSATNVRLQEASIGYTIPKKKLGNVVEMTISLVGRNLWMIYNKAPFDPEAVATTGNYYQGIDYFMMPNTRNIGFNVRLKF